MKYEVYCNEKGKKRVKFENGVDYCINIDGEGREYFPVPNMFDEDKFHLFIGRIKDAIETIRQGDGDALGIHNLFGNNEVVYKFVDRKYGEEIRAKTIEGFKDAVFGYSLKFGYLDSMSGDRYITKDEKIISIFDAENQNNYIYFDTEQEAENFKQEILTKAKRFVDNYTMISVNNKNNEKKIDKWLHNHFDKTVSTKIGCEMIDYPDKKRYGLDVVQVIKPQI